MSTETPGAGVSPAEYQKLIRSDIRRKERIRELEGLLAERDGRIAELTKERDDFAAGFEELDGQLQQLQSDPEGLAGRVKGLEKELAETRGRSRFEKLAGGQIREDALADAWGFLGMDFAGGEVDDKAIEAGIVSLVESKPYLKAQPPAGDAAGDEGGGKEVGGADAGRVTVTASGAGPGLGRGTKAPPATDPATRARDTLARAGAVAPNGAIKLA